MIKKIGFYLLLTLLWIACQNQSNSSQNTADPGKEEPENTATAAAPELEKLYPSLPADRMRELYNNVDYIDFVFYYTNFSMNQSDDASIKASLSHVSSEVPGIDASCQPIGSLFFQSKGRELIQAELYFTENCIYYVWLEKGKRTYANMMTPGGFKFYEQVFSQASTQQ